MTLEDFFTSTELEDGLTTPSRVNDLLAIMQNQKENIVKNVSEATQQWSAVATTIAATENKECLDLFIKLDGLSFIDKWLNDAQKLINDTGTGSLEELVLALLRALKRLQVDNHQSMGSGIGLTVQGLLGHSSLVVREKAKDLRDRWGPVDISPGGNINEGNMACSDTVEQQTDKEELVTEKVIMESGTDIIKVENDKSKSDSTPLTGTLAIVEDAQEIDSLTTFSNPLEHTTLTSNTDADHALESATKTERMEDESEKDEEVVCRVADSVGGLQESSGAENPKSSSNLESDEDDKKEAGLDSGNNSGSCSPLSKPSMKSQNHDLISNRPSDMELDYGTVDPLELARQVAMEVEVEVDSQEQSCSSTSTNEKECQSAAGGLGNEVSPEPMKDLETLDNPVTQISKIEESALYPDKGFSGFDLNQEVSFDEIETDHPAENSISVVVSSSSRVAVTADGPPVAPLQFEGAVGWKGSAAATSAFRRIPDSENTFSSSSSHSNSNQRLNRFEFDLNVAESTEDRIQDFLSGDKIEEPSRLQLDLNSLGDSDSSIITLDRKLDSRVASLRQNRPRSPSVSPSVQPSFRNIDLNLNDHLTILNNASFGNPFLGKLFNNKREEPVISIFGTQVEVNRTDNIPSQHNGRILEPSVDFSLGGSAYGYGHNGFTMYDPLTTAPVPYMVDSRGASIVPPIQPTQPFFFNMGANGAPPGSNVAGASRNTYDLNSGFITERGNLEKNKGGLRQFFNHNQASSSSVIGGKREQPDSGWDFFPINYKHHQPPWQ